AILKHTNACGVASRPTIKQAWIDALACDPISAFGGVLIANGEIDKETAEEINNLFFEVLIAPAYTADALTVLTAKKKRIILKCKADQLSIEQFKTLLDGFMLQDIYNKVDGPVLMKTVTTVQPTAAQLDHFYYANKIVKHTNSNAIVFANDKTLVASG